MAGNTEALKDEFFLRRFFIFYSLKDLTLISILATPILTTREIARHGSTRRTRSGKTPTTAMKLGRPQANRKSIGSTAPPGIQ
jgi:hypothetical protein